MISKISAQTAVPPYDSFRIQFLKPPARVRPPTATQNPSHLATTHHDPAARRAYLAFQPSAEEGARATVQDKWRRRDEAPAAVPAAPPPARDGISVPGPANSVSTLPHRPHVPRASDRVATWPSSAPLPSSTAPTDHRFGSTTRLSVAEYMPGSPSVKHSVHKAHVPPIRRPAYPHRFIGTCTTSSGAAAAFRRLCRGVPAASGARLSGKGLHRLTRYRTNHPVALKRQWIAFGIKIAAPAAPAAPAGEQRVQERRPRRRRASSQAPRAPETRRRSGFDPRILRSGPPSSRETVASSCGSGVVGTGAEF